jgi:pimeloyl-ACP methyl ester carboxylesterase
MLNLLRRPRPTREGVVEAQLRFFREAGSTGFFRDEIALAERAGRAFDRAHHPAGFARQFAAVVATGDLRDRLGSVRVPTLVLHGSADGIFRPFCARETAEAIIGARLHIVPGWGHDLAEGVWDVLVEAIASHARSHARE